MSDTKPIRKGEELNSGRLLTFLRDNLAFESEDLSIEQFPAGASNLTYLISAGDSEYVLRRPPFGNRVKSAHDMAREFNVLSKLALVYKPAPRPLLYCDEEDVIGSEFYLMERRKGLIIRGAMPNSQTAGSTQINSENFQKTICESFIVNLADLHALDYEEIGLGDLGKPEGYAQRQVEGWMKRYRNAKTDEWTELESAIKWLESNIPADDPPALVHNDYKFDNIMLDPADLTKIIAVLDWEMTTIGSPLMDLGTTLGYWMSKDAGEEMLSMPFNPRILMENISRKELVEIYAKRSARDVSNILFYYAFGTFKIAVIAQQIYYRFVKGFTTDARFARFDHFVDKLGKIAAQAIERDSI